MKNKNLFEIATRKQLRFPFKGLISVEDLWQLSVSDLDIIFKKLNTQVKQANEESLLNKKTAEDEVLDIQIELVKYIVSVKLAESEAKLIAQAKKEQKQKIMSIISEKQDTDLQNKSLDELKAMLGELED